MSQAIKQLNLYKNPRSLCKGSISLHNLRALSSKIEISDLVSQDTSPKIALKSKLTLRVSKKSPQHKRTISESSLKSTEDNNPTLQLEIHYNKLKAHLEKTLNPKEKLNILLVFIENLLKINTEYADMLKTISEVIREYRKYVKNLDSTRIENMECKSEIKNAVFNKDCSKRIVYKKQYNKCFNEGNSVKIDGLKNELISMKKIHLIRNSIENDEIKPIKNAPHKRNFTIPGLKIPIGQDKGYHEEFIGKFDEFSDSWKEELLKLNK